MMSEDTKQEALNNFGNTLFKLSGLYEAIPDLIDAIEEDIAGSYEAIKEENEDEEADYYPDNKDNCYGGEIFVTFHILKDGKPNEELNYCDITEKQKILLNVLSTDGEMSLSVNRVDYQGHKWGIAFSVPKRINENTERFDIFLTLDMDAYTLKKYEIKVGTKEDIDTETLNKLSLMYQLKYS